MCVLCTHPVELSVLRSSNPKLYAKKKVNHCPSSVFGARHHHEFKFCHEEFCHDEDDENEECDKFPAALCTYPSCFPIKNIITIITSFELLIQILTHLFARINWSVELLCFHHILVLQSLTISFSCGCGIIWAL